MDIVNALALTELGLGVEPAIIWYRAQEKWENSLAQYGHMRLDFAGIAVNPTNSISVE